VFYLHSYGTSTGLVQHYAYCNFHCKSPAIIKVLVWKATNISEPSPVLLSINAKVKVNHLGNRFMWITQCKTSRCHKLLTTCKVNWCTFCRTLTSMYVSLTHSTDKRSSAVDLLYKNDKRMYWCNNWKKYLRSIHIY